MLSNPQSIELRLWPFDLAWTASAAIAVLSIAAIAFLLGALIAWAAALPARRRGRAAERRVIELEANLKTLSAAREAADQKALTKA
jgi:Pyruvate/2-oxoacid:ferredoxin oxidoreductase gamma subunit